MSKNKTERVEPLFFLNNEVDQDGGSYLNTLEVCLAVCSVVSDESTVEGAQRIGGLWRIYLTDQNTRVQALCTGINIRDIQINLKDKNPYLVAGHDEVESTRLYIRNVPLSYDNDAIENSIKSLGVQMLGSLKYVRARTPAGKLTNFKTGDRFVDIIAPHCHCQRKSPWAYSPRLCTTKNRSSQPQKLSVEIANNLVMCVEIAKMSRYVTTA